ncbi:MAG: serine protease [Gammaproteobacteria bacterium]
MRITMMVRDVITTPIMVVCLQFLCNTAPQAAGVEDSIVKIIAGERSGTSFVWQGERDKYIATSLHTLAGATEIYYNKTLYRYELEVYKIDKESDLALLRPKRGAIKQPALKLGNIEPVDGKKYRIYGFPAGVLDVQGDSLEFSKAKHNIPMKDYLPNEVVKRVTASGFPQASLKLLRVSSGITPGHSGAPIIDPSDDNAVIDIGAGGLSNVGYQRVNWAVPALTYLTRLETRGSQENVARLSLSQDKRKFGMLSEKAAPPLATSQSKYYNIDQVPLEDLLESLNEPEVDPEEQTINAEDLRHFREQAKENGYDLSALIDVYQNTQTGAMVFIPAAIPRSSISTQGNLLIAGTGKTQMYLQITQAKSFHEALRAKDDYIAFLDTKLGAEDWKLDHELSDDSPSHDPEEGYWEQSILKYSGGSADDAQSDIDVYLEIVYDDEAAYGDLLGVAVVGRDYPDFTWRDEELLFHVNACAWVSGFVPD